MKKIFTLLLFGVFAWSSVQAQYCTPAYSFGCGSGDDLNSFSISNLSHLNTGCGPNNGFENYTATTGVDTIDLEQGVPYVFTVTTNYFSNEYLGIWIDFNNDQDFADAGELLYYSTTSFGSSAPLTASFAMPTGQTTGIRRMRVRVIYATGGSAPDPCNSYSFGEAHDYSVNVLPQPACLPVLGVSVPNSGIGSTTANVTWTSAGNDFDVQYGIAGFTLGTGTVVSNVATTSYNITSLTANTTYDVYVRQDCGMSGFSSWSKATFKTLCAATAIPSTENFDTWPLACFDPLGGGQPFVSYSLFPGSAAQANMSNWFGQNSAIMTTQPFIIAGPARVKFKWSHAYNQFAPNESILIEAKLEASPNFTDTIFFLSGTNFESNDGAFSWSPGSFKLDLANIPASLIGNVVIRITASSQGFGSSLWLDDFIVEPQPACAEPTNFQFTNVGYDQVAFSFDQATTNNYQLDWGPCGFTQGTASTLVNFTGTTYNLTGLTQNTCYDFYIRTDCNPANGYSAWMGPFTVTTSCAQSLGWTENFDLLPQYSPAPCWRVISAPATFSSQSVVPPWNFTPTSAPNVLDYYVGSDPTNLLVSPALLGLDADTTQIRFRMRSANAGAGQTVIIGTVTSNTSGASFVPADTITINNSMVSYTVMFDNVPAGHQYAAFRSGLSSFSSLYLDDVIFEAIPACIPPNNPILNSVGTTTANVSFGAGGANLYNYNWGPCGFTPGTGVFVSGQTGTSYTATGLAPGSCYDLYIQTDCGVAGTSPWVGPLTFTTLCLPNAMPYLEDFTTWPPACFQLVNGGLDWQHDPTGYATVQFWNGNGQAKMITKSVFISQQAQVSFLWAKQYSQFSPNEALTLRAQVVGNTSWDTLVHLSGPSFNSPNAGYFTPPASKSDFVSELTFLDSATYVGQTVVFELIGQADYGPWPFVDDFAVEVIPACPKPTAVLASNITQTTVNLAWTSNAPGSSWQISYGPPSGTAATGTKVSVPTNPFTLTGLSPSTSYCVYVREICGPGDTSIWSTVNCFTTACGPVSLPYVEDFSANALSTCWGNFNLSGDTQTNSFWRNTSSFWPNYAAQGVIDHTGNGGFAMGVDGSFPYPLNDIIMETPELIFTGVPSPELSFWMFSSVAGFGTAADLNELYVDFYNGTTWNNGIYYFKGDSASWFKITVPLSAYPVSGGNAKIRFRVNKIGVTAFYNDIIVDDISVASGSSCPPPTAVAPSNIGCDVMDVTFVSGSGTSQLEYGPAGFTPGTGTVINPATSPVSISGLTPGTNYQVYVSDLCGGVPSPAAGPIAVTTASGPLPSGAFTYTVTSTGATFNASASTGGTTYTWDFGNNTTGTGVNPSATFAANGNYTVTLIVGNACGNDTLTQNVFINIGLDDLQLSNSFKAWPNPTQGLLNVEFALGSGNATLEVLDLTGRVLMTEQFTAQGLTKKELNLANYAKGVYLVRVSSGAASATRKITLQ